MDSGPRHIRELHPAEVDVIRKTLAPAFAEPLRESEDFDRDAMIFRTPRGGLVTFPKEFLSDFDLDTIRHHLGLWNVSDQAKALSQGQRLLVTTDGTFVEG